SVIPQPDQLERIFNIFHPYDPVAYRLEPVFHENYRHVRPMKLLSSTNARQCYESAVYECHASYLKSQSKSKKKKKGGGKSGEDKLVEDNESKSGGKTHTQSEGEDDEQRHFRHGADSDSDDDAPSNGSRHQQTTRRTSPTSVAPNTPTTAHGPGDCSATLAAPEEVDSACEAGEDGVGGDGGGGQQDERTAAAATPTDDVLRRTFTALEQNGGGGSGAVGGGGGDGTAAAVPATAELGKDECGGEGRSPTGAAVAETAAAAGTTAGAAAAAASLDDPKFGDAAHLVEDIPAERRLPLRLDFQIQPGAVPNGYWAMLRSHFSY
uniref:DDHD domain-containing protein n=1 Tax=Globodera pallida TaxID=36090 RepID=A0A183CQU9_GLOPA